MEMNSKVEFNPYSLQFAADPYPIYAALRQNNPIFYDPDWGVTFVTTHQDVNDLLVHKSLGRTMDHLLEPEELTRRHYDESQCELANYHRYVSRNLLETEGKDHARLRRLLVKGFTTAQIANQREGIQALADRTMDELEAQGEMDLLEDVANPLTVHVIAALLGMPQEDHHLLRPWSAAIVKLYEKNTTEQDEQAAETATIEFVRYLEGLLVQRRARPGDDLISVLAQVEDEGAVLKNDELISTCILLLNAGHESTVNTAGNGMLALLRHPEQLAQLKANPALAGSAVEEILRYDPPLQYFHRYVLEDTEFKGHAFKQGDTIGLLYGAANRDPAAFENPDNFDIKRTPNKHLAFGKGRHFCLGAPLARLELEIIFNTLLARFPNIHLAAEQPEYHTGLVFRGLKSLKLRW
jgi:cytochrome P450